MLVSIDRAGRVVIPKEVRDRLGLEPDTQLDLRVHGHEIRLEPQRGRRRTLDHVDGRPVFRSVPGHSLTDAAAAALRDADQR